jgi:hypothetical protein
MLTVAIANDASASGPGHCDNHQIRALAESQAAPA